MCAPVRECRPRRGFHSLSGRCTLPGVRAAIGVPAAADSINADSLLPAAASRNGRGVVGRWQRIAVYAVSGERPIQHRSTRRGSGLSRRDVAALRRKGLERGAGSITATNGIGYGVAFFGGAFAGAAFFGVSSPADLLCLACVSGARCVGFTGAAPAGWGDVGWASSPLPAFRF